MFVENQVADAANPNPAVTAAETQQAQAEVQTQEDIELAEAERALAEESAQAAKPATTPEVTQAQPAKAEQAVTTEEDHDSQIENGRIPVKALTAERKARQEAERQAAYLQGQLEAMKAVMQPQEPKKAEPVVDPVEQRMTEIEAERVALAEQFDEGSLSAKQWEEQRRALEREERKLWSEQQNQTQQNQAPTIANDAVMENHLTQLEAKYPVLGKLTQEDLAPLKDLAYRQAAMSGKPIPQGAVGTMQLRERIAILASNAYGIPPVQQPAPAAPKPPALSPQAQARDAKMNMAATMPPDVSSMGAAGSGTGLSEAEFAARLEMATDDEQIALLEAHPNLVQKITQGR